MAGLTDQGFVGKRQGEVLVDLRNQAQPIFQDLVPPGDVVDTGNSSTIGRLTGLLSLPLADLWEAAQQVYLAFDPNSASGVALDNLVMYGGLTRNPPSASTATVVVWGNEGTFIPASLSQIRSEDSNLYEVSISVSLDREQCNGARFTIPSVVVGTTYGVDIVSQSTTASLSYEAVSGDTANDILSELFSQVASYTYLDAEITSNSLSIVTDNILDYISVVPTNVVVSKIRTRTEVRNLEVGNIPQEANTITRIATPILGWDSVNNPFPAVTGRDSETDEELRIRFRNSKFLRAQNISDSLYSSLLEIDGVINVNVYENEGSVYDPTYELPGHSFKAVILGGNPTEIANTIWANKPLGIAAEGNTSVSIFDSQGFERQIYFERPEDIEIFITMDLTVTEPSIYPADAQERIRSSLISYFQDNFGIGGDIVYSRLYTPINAVPGHQVNSLTVGTTSSPTGTSNIVIDYNQIANLNSNNIIITVS